MPVPPPRPALLPAPPTGGRSGWPWVASLLLVSAWVLLWPASGSPGALLPGDALHPDGPGTFNYHWLVHQAGLSGAAHSTWLFWPVSVDRLVMDGFPLDALASWPLLALLGWPAGFTIFVLLCLWGAGLAMAWWSSAWWRSPLAGLVAGVTYQASHILMLELYEGRATQVFAAIWLPLALGFGWRALAAGAGGRRQAVMAGLATGLAALSYWYALFLTALGLAVLLVLARPRRWRQVGALTVGGALGSVLIMALPLLYTLLHLDQQTGLQFRGGDTLLDAGRLTSLVAITSMRSLQASWRGGLPLQPLFLLMLLAGTLRLPRERWLGPALMALVGCGLALGPAVSILQWTIPGPYRLVLEVPLLRRWWWPVRAMLLAAPALSLLAGGGGARVLRQRPLAGTLLAAALLVESFLVMPQLPLPTLPGTPTVTARVLAQGQGPALVLPFPSGALRSDTLPLLDQIHHGRPLAMGQLPPDNPLAPAAYRALWQRPALAALVACEHDPRALSSASAAQVRAALEELGIQEVYVDQLVARTLPLGDAYLGCLNRLLGPPTAMHEPYRVHRAGQGR